MSDREIKITYRGWPGHYCASRYCIFHLNTLLELEETRIVVSTVGNMWDPLDKNSGTREVAIGCYYETMAFFAQLTNGYWDSDVTKQVTIAGPRRVDHIDRMSDEEAQKIHESVVEEIAGRIRRGELV